MLNYNAGLWSLLPLLAVKYLAIFYYVFEQNINNRYLKDFAYMYMYTYCAGNHWCRKDFQYVCVCGGGGGGVLGPCFFMWGTGFPFVQFVSHLAWLFVGGHWDPPPPPPLQLHPCWKLIRNQSIVVEEAPFLFPHHKHRRWNWQWNINLGSYPIPLLSIVHIKPL